MLSPISGVERRRTETATYHASPFIFAVVTHGAGSVEGVAVVRYRQVLLWLVVGSVCASVSCWEQPKPDVKPWSEFCCSAEVAITRSRWHNDFRVAVSLCYFAAEFLRSWK